jgi:hypothetical protein
MADEPRPNMPKIRRILRDIDANPETWNQEFYGHKTACGTSFCIAGHAVNNEGIGMAWAKHDCEPFSFGASDTTDHRSIAEVAQDILGLTYSERSDLFDGENDRERVEDVCNQIAARAGEPLWPEEVTHA